ncbi:MAG: hypothetical protein AAB448_04505 [Patescibacteria group bacterium]
MAEQPIFVMNPESRKDAPLRESTSEALAELNKAFVSPLHETISGEEVEQIAEHVSGEIVEALESYKKEKRHDGELERSEIQQASFILHMLQIDKLITEIRFDKRREFKIAINNSDSVQNVVITWNPEGEEPVRETFTRQELDSAIEPLRRAILDKLTPALPESIRILISRHTLHEYGKAGAMSDVDELEDGTILKRGRAMANFKQAMEQYHGLEAAGKSSPYVNFFVHDYEFLAASDPNKERYSAIIKKLPDVVTLIDLVSGEKEGRISIKVAIRYLVDAMRGAAYLVDNGLILSDISLDNIRIDLEKGIGQLFDFDGLKPVGTEGYWVKTSYRPPEFNPDMPRRLDGEIGQEKSMVYEFGFGLRLLASRYPADTNNALSEYILRMTAEVDNSRPTLKEAIVELERLMVT